MTFVSYAQNFEDVLLQRCFKDIKNGFYIDVGAAWPKQDSVTQAFYERGWHGINIELNPKLYTELKRERPRDINLNLAISDQCETIETNIFPDAAGLSTGIESIALKHTESGKKPEKKTVEAKTLTEACQEHVEKKQIINFLKIDIEGMELKAIKGFNLNRFRPQVIIIEGTWPNSRKKSHKSWEPLILSADYQFVYFDGLNRFYISNEKAELAQHFIEPVNIWDDFVRYNEHKLQQALDRLNRNLAVRIARKITNHLPKRKKIPHE